MRKVLSLFCCLLSLGALHVQAQDAATPVADLFPAGAELRPTSQAWMEVVADDGTLLGYAADSRPYSDGIMGYGGETPLRVAFTTDWKIAGVQLLDNSETPGFVKRATAGGLFTQWNGLSVGEALARQADVVSGATYTSKSVVASMQALLTQLNTAVPQASSASGCGWCWAVGIVVLVALVVVWVVVRRRRVANRK